MVLLKEEINENKLNDDEYNNHYFHREWLKIKNDDSKNEKIK